jgi:hypothetical protein
MDEKGSVPDESWMTSLKEAAATTYLGTRFICRLDPYSLALLFVHLIGASETVRGHDILMKI